MKALTALATAALLATAAGHAVAQHEITPSEARRAINALEQADTTLANAIRLAERHTDGTALSAQILTSADTHAFYMRYAPEQGRGQSDREGDRQRPDRERDNTRDDGTQQQQPDRQRPSDRGDQQSMRNQNAPHAVVTCLVSRSQLRDVLVNLESRKVVNVRSAGSTWRSGDDSDRPTRDSDRTRSADSERSMRLASHLINANVVNAQDEDLGDIDDLALDLTSNRVRYAVLKRGGFLGIGDKALAIPLRALKMSGRDQVRLDVEESELEDRKGFDQGDWPQQAQQGWGNRERDNRDEADRADDSRARADGTVEKASDIIGKSLHADDESLGSVEDLVIGVQEERIAYVVISSEGGQTAVPAEHVRLVNRKLMLVDMDRGEFMTLPTYRDDQRPDWTDPEWRQQFEGERDADREVPRRGGGG